jgi:trans-2,3-dihydro-3-hydroxyanthranilate isomerase
MTHRHRYLVVDVFTRKPLEGNALAVFPDASGIGESAMPAIARELNLSETTFVFPATHADCAARVRIFTPARELPFAGHPTVGTAWVLRREGVAAAQAEGFALEEKVGPVPVRVEKGEGGEPLIWLTTPAIADGPTYDRGVCAQSLGLPVEDLLDIPPQRLSAGNPTLLIGLRDQAAVDRAWLEGPGMRQLRGDDDGAFCVFVFTPTQQGAYSRMFSPEYGVAEDPATGSSTGPLAAYMMRHKLAPSASGTRWTSEQGTKMRRRSFLHVRIQGSHGADGIEVGGYVAPLVEAVMSLESDR